MRLATLALCVGGGTLIATSATADFIGLRVESKPNEFGILVCNVYAEFDHVNDFMFAVIGSEANPSTISVVDGTFYQHPFGSDRPPPGALVDVFPSVAYDSFVTIGVKCFGDPPCQPVDALLFGNGWPGFGSSVLSFGGFWAVLIGTPQGEPFNPDYSSGGNGQVLIGQFSTADATAIVGDIEVQYYNQGVGPIAQQVTFEHTVDVACFSVLTEQTVCHAGGNGFTYIVSGAESCSGSPFDFSFTASGGAVGEELCFTVVVSDDEGGTCCVAELCTTVPDCTPSTTLWDMDGDGEVGIIDVLLLLATWGPCGNYCLPGDCPGDFDGDCAVQVSDLLLMFQNWG